MDELTAWLRGQLDEDERVVRQMMAEPGGFYLEAETDSVNIMTIGAYVYRWPPKRVLAEVKANRRILDLHDPSETTKTCCPTCRDYDDAVQAPCPTVRLLAQSYAGQPGWRKEWQLSDGA